MTADAGHADIRPREHIFGDLGLTVEAHGEEMRGTADVVPHMLAPGTESLRVSVLFTWADVVLGHLVAQALARIPVTLELDIHLFEDIRGCNTVTSVARVAKAGRSVAVCTIDFASERRRVGFGHGLLMPTANLPPTMPRGSPSENPLTARRGALMEPFASRAGCERTGRGVASLPCQPRVLSGKALNGGITALVVEEAVLSADADARTIASMALRYLRPVRAGPAVARAEVHAGLGTIEVYDASSNALAVLATTRFFGA